ncbi:MAG: glycoside hydrolase family 2 TIM barrel-domain containing protein, partial [Kiritimatiellae bacterium]|nr:glycoside hydrolase family 2 TIM barrel-domain containing protein [Kiritimatiellia bacterium]
MPRHYSIEERICLNGWWDFLPVTDNAVAETVPVAGWGEAQYLVPSFWTKLPDGVRQKGEKYFTERNELFKEPAALTADTEFLFDAFGYPNDWSRTRRAWVRRTAELPALPADRRWFLEFEAVEPKPTLYVNGRRICTHIHPTLPLVADVTEHLHAGINEIALYIDDYDRDENGRVKVPIGSWNVSRHCGIWQDVHLVQRDAVRVDDVTIRTSFRERCLEIIWQLDNSTGEARTLEVCPTIHAWDRLSRAALDSVDLPLPSFTIEVPANGGVTHTVCVPWNDAKLWQPESPNLYVLQTAITGGETHRERFGFREVWIDGGDLMFNGYPLHLFSDWGHKLTPYCFTENWIRQWFGMIRDANMNHSRLHTHPHPELIMDLADEEGILITGETGIFGSGASLAADSPEFWDASRDHIRRFVRRDKNHPCVIMWSVENEARWNPHKTRQLDDTLPQLRKLFNALDPTRAAYHEGDSSLWNESEQEIISRHYYKACAGTGWWKRERPLHSGEMSLYHYAGPNNTAHLGGDRCWASFRAFDEAAARDTAMIIEAGRAAGVCCFGPWNLSCLENLRMDSEFVRLGYADYTTPGMKPLQVPPHSSEFSFWKAGVKGYTPNWSFAIQKTAFRPFAVIDLSQRSGYFTDARLKRRVFVANDTAADVRGVLNCMLLAPADRTMAATVQQEFVIGRGHRAELDVDLALTTVPPGKYLWRCQFTESGSGAVLDAWERPLFLGSRRGEALPVARIAVLGPGSLRPLWASLNVNPVYIASLNDIAKKKFELLILEKNTVVAGSTQNRQIQAFCRTGGRVLVMEQEVSLFSGLPLEDKPLQTQMLRAPTHPVLAGITEPDLAFWGDAPYPEQGGDAFVVHRAYRKGDGKHALYILDGDEGGFGHGGLAYAGLIEIREGTGLILACQLNVTTKAGEIPAAATLFGNMVRRLLRYRGTAPQPVLQVDGATLAPEKAAQIVATAMSGHSIVVNNATGNVLAAFARASGVELRLADCAEPVCQAVRVQDDPVLSGVSNEDTCGIETWTYCPQENRNCVIGSRFLEPLPGLEPLLATPVESVLREFFALGGRSEPLRAHTLSRFLYAEKNERFVVLGRVKAGAGQILFNQFAPPADAPQRASLARLQHRLAANLGVVPEGSLLDGDQVPESGVLSSGYPEKIHLLNAPVDPEMHQRLLSSTQYRLEYISSSPIFGVAEWRHDVPCPNGEIAASGLDTKLPIYAYMR